jgi:hypothetical protein
MVFGGGLAPNYPLGSCSILHTDKERWRKYSLTKSLQDIKNKVMEKNGVD